MFDAEVDTALWITAYRQMHSAMLNADTPSLRRLLTRDFVLVHITGYAQPCAEWLEHIAAGRMRYRTSTEESVVVKQDGQRYWLRGRNRVQADIWGAQGTWPLEMAIDFRREQGRWLMSRAVASTY